MTKVSGTAGNSPSSGIMGDEGISVEEASDVVQTSLRPDIVVWSEHSEKIIRTELTAPWEDACERALSTPNQVLPIDRRDGVLGFSLWKSGPKVFQHYLSGECTRRLA